MQQNGSPFILVVDDDRGVRDLVALYLRRMGYSVDVAEDGNKAIERLKGAPPLTIVICDIMMPGPSGLEVLRQVKKERPEIEFIMGTSNAAVQTAVDSMRDGAYDFVPKPYNLDHLAGVVQKALERKALQGRVDRLSELNRLKDEFMATISHELRTPLSVIIGYTSLFLGNVYGGMSDVQRRGMEHIDAKSKSLLNMINMILELAKFSAGRIEIVRETFRVTTVVDDVVQSLKPGATEKDVDIVADVEDGLIFTGDKSKTSQIVGHLAANAVKFTAKGTVQISAKSDGPDYWQLRVEDTGIGISAEQLPTLFERFHQIDGSVTRRFGGAGLGLALVKKLAEVMRGTVTVESQVGRGSVFTIRLPRVAPDLPASVLLKSDEKSVD